MVDLNKTATLYRAWMDEAIDCDIRGNPIKRRTAYGALDAMTGEVAFAAGYAAAPQVSTGPGSAAWRLNLLMRELEKRFPHPNPVDSTKTPEQYALEAIDSLIRGG